MKLNHVYVSLIELNTSRGEGLLRERRKRSMATLMLIRAKVRVSVGKIEIGTDMLTKESAITVVRKAILRMSVVNERINVGNAVSMDIFRVNVSQ